ncbi:MAG: carboxylate-amine ligase [Caulobacterales bacterium]|nr:carboxylate-amine ligase [Caulobacterales bacterium]
MTASLTIGIEEEYLLVDPTTRDLAASPDGDFMTRCRDELGAHVSPEFLRCQVEIGTPVCHDIADARRHLTASRAAIRRNAAKCGIAVMAASTHPFARWGDQAITPSERYEKLERDMQGAVRRMLICGMHVHAAIEDPDARIDVMNQVRYFLPHLLALSTSSPFWLAQPMGLHCSRLSVWYGMPRTGIPDAFDGWGEYQRFIDALVGAGVMDDATKLWWDIRPSARYPTLELRITDVCTRLEDALCIAAFYQCLLRMLLRLRRDNMRWRIYPTELIRENRWLARRYGVSGQLLDLGRGARVPFPALVEELIALVDEDAQALGCAKEVAHARTIIERGTSSMTQLRVFDEARAGGADEREAFAAVVDALIAETGADLPQPAEA